jgi:hypothetical protein
MIIIYEDIKIITKFSKIVNLEISKFIADPIQAHLITSFFWSEIKTPKV